MFGLGLGVGVLTPKAGEAAFEQRPATPTSQQLLFAGNSFDQTPNGAVTSGGSHGGNLVTNWPGGTMFDFVDFGSLQQIWELNGNLRNNMTWDVLVMCETPPSLVTGYPTPGGDAFSQASFQHAFWFGEEAKRRSADVILLVPWTPTGSDGLLGNITGWFQFMRNWLAQKTGRNVWLFPAHRCVQAMKDLGHTPISGDGLHLDHAYARVLSGALWYMLNKTPYPFVETGYEALDAACRSAVGTYRWAGLGGSFVESAVVAADPLVTPTPLPVTPVTAALAQPPMLITGPEATFTSASGWTIPAGVTVDTTPPGRAVVDGTYASRTIERDIAPLDTNKDYVLTAGFRSLVTARTQLALLNGGGSIVVGNNAYHNGHRVARYRPTLPHSRFRINVLSQGANPTGEVIDGQVVDITQLLANPKAIFACFGQSQEQGSFGVTGFDPELDSPEFRALAVPSMNNANLGCSTDGTGATYGLTSSQGIGIPVSMTTPLTHATGTDMSLGKATAVIPALSRAKYMCDNWPIALAGFTPTYLLAAATGTSFLNPAHWQRPNGPYWRLMLAQIRALIAAVPGSFLAGAFLQQGEADGPNPAWITEATGMVADLRAEFGNVPLVISEIGGRRDTGNIQATIDMQRTLASNSGSPNALARCRYNPRPAGLDTDLLEDESGSWIHYRASTARTMGTTGGADMVELLLS